MGRVNRGQVRADFGRDHRCGLRSDCRNGCRVKSFHGSDGVREVGIVAAGRARASALDAGRRCRRCASRFAVSPITGTQTRWRQRGAFGPDCGVALHDLPVEESYRSGPCRNARRYSKHQLPLRLAEVVTADAFPPPCRWVASFCGIRSPATILRSIFWLLAPIASPGTESSRVHFRQRRPGLKRAAVGNFHQAVARAQGSTGRKAHAKAGTLYATVLIQQLPDLPAVQRVAPAIRYWLRRSGWRQRRPDACALKTFLRRDRVRRCRLRRQQRYPTVLRTRRHRRPITPC